VQGFAGQNVVPYHSDILKIARWKRENFSPTGLPQTRRFGYTEIPGFSNLTNSADVHNNSHGIPCS
jgi:hypothetical protein